MLAHISRILLVMAIIQSWLAAAWLFRSVTQQKQHSLSYHGGSQLKTYLVFAATLSLSAAAFAFATVAWIIPTFQPGPGFTVAATIGIVCMFLTAWIRDGTNPTLHFWHIIFAYSMALTMPIMLVLLLIRPTPIAFQLLGAVSVCIMGFFWVLFLGFKSSRRHYLLYQAAYIIGFQLSFVALAISHATLIYK